MKKGKGYIIKTRLRHDDEAAPKVVFNNLFYGDDEADALRRLVKTLPYHVPVSEPEHAPWA